jgi:branched-chain amino acid transport system ATP-binding protein
MSLLNVTGLKVQYGGIQALSGISFQVEKGQIVSLIGANGAGKSTTLRAITSLVPMAGGRIEYEGEHITTLDTQQMIRKGIVLVPEGRKVFPNLSTLENLKVGAYTRRDAAGISSDIEKVYTLFPRLKERHWQLAGTLSGGEQQMLAVGRALMARPKLLMMDEPSLGLAPLVVRDIFQTVLTLHGEGITILLVEQNANAALKIADRGYVLETGRITITGTGKELLENPMVREAYLGRASAK